MPEVSLAHPPRTGVAIFDDDSGHWRHPERWPPDDDHPLFDSSPSPRRAALFICRAVERLSAYAPPEKSPNEARLWAAEAVAAAARTGSIRTNLDGATPHWESLFAGTGRPDLDSARFASILRDCGVRSRQGHWVPLFVDAADLDRLVADIGTRAQPTPALSRPSTDISGVGAAEPIRSVSEARRASRLKPFWPDARQVALTWLTDNGCPARGDGEQATLERWLAQWLEDRGHKASETAVRRHVGQWIKERRAELDEQGSLGSFTSH